MKIKLISFWILGAGMPSFDEVFWSSGMHIILLFGLLWFIGPIFAILEELNNFLKD